MAMRHGRLDCTTLRPPAFRYYRRGLGSTLATLPNAHESLLRVAGCAPRKTTPISGVPERGLATASGPRPKPWSPASAAGLWVAPVAAGSEARRRQMHKRHSAFFRLDPELLDDRPPFHGIGLHQRAESFRCLLVAREDVEPSLSS
jgi:hypothetical protein